MAYDSRAHYAPPPRPYYDHQRGAPLPARPPQEQYDQQYNQQYGQSGYDYGVRQGSANGNYQQDQYAAGYGQQQPQQQPRHRGPRSPNEYPYGGANSQPQNHQTDKDNGFRPNDGFPFKGNTSPEPRRREHHGDDHGQRNGQGRELVSRPSDQSARSAQSQPAAKASSHKPSAAERQRLFEQPASPELTSWDNPFPTFPAAKKKNKPPRNDLDTATFNMKTNDGSRSNGSSMEERPATAHSKSSHGSSRGHVRSSSDSQRSQQSQHSQHDQNHMGNGNGQSYAPRPRPPEVQQRQEPERRPDKRFYHPRPFGEDQAQSNGHRPMARQEPTSEGRPLSAEYQRSYGPSEPQSRNRMDDSTHPRPFLDGRQPPYRSNGPLQQYNAPPPSAGPLQPPNAPYQLPPRPSTAEGYRPSWGEQSSSDDGGPLGGRHPSATPLPLRIAPPHNKQESFGDVFDAYYGDAGHSQNSSNAYQPEEEMPNFDAIPISPSSHRRGMTIDQHLPSPDQYQAPPPAQHSIEPAGMGLEDSYRRRSPGFAAQAHRSRSQPDLRGQKATNSRSADRQIGQAVFEMTGDAPDVPPMPQNYPSAGYQDHRQGPPPNQDDYFGPSYSAQAPMPGQPRPGFSRSNSGPDQYSQRHGYAQGAPGAQGAQYAGPPPGRRPANGGFRGPPPGPGRPPPRSGRSPPVGPGAQRSPSNGPGGWATPNGQGQRSPPGGPGGWPGPNGQGGRLPPNGPGGWSGPNGPGGRPGPNGYGVRSPPNGPGTPGGRPPPNGPGGRSTPNGPGMRSPPNGAGGRGAPNAPADQTQNPDALPSHPAPVRPGLMPGSLANQSQNGKPAPIRQYNNSAPPAQQAVTAPPSHPGVQRRISQPVTHQELERLKEVVKRDPSDYQTQLVLAKKWVEAATVLADDGGKADQKTKTRNRERYIFDAHKLVKKLSNAGYSEATFYLADCYSSGRLGLESDQKEAYNLYHSAAKAGHPQAAYRTAVCCELGSEDGGGTKKDPLKAIQWYKKAASLGDTPAMYKMGMILLRGLLGQQTNPKEAITWLKRAADRADVNNPHALHQLGLLYEKASNKDSIIQDEVYSKQLFSQAADLGYKFSQHRLGSAYEYGLMGCPIDPRQSIAWYSKAAVQEEHQSELALSGWYLTGAEGVLAQSDTEAYLWARKAAQAGLAKAEYAMGYFTEVGIGAPANLEDAKRWYWRAAAQNFPQARERLDELRKNGAKVQRSRERVSRSNVKHEGECSLM